jgi:two-component system, chemotaxis family, chemotaxis protein CheY
VAINVLVVDDSAIMRQMMIKTLSLCGIPIGEVHQAGNGQAGLEILENHWLDLVLVDLTMPVMDGEEMIRRLRENPEIADVAVIVVSTEGSETRIEKLQKMSLGFVHKPFNPEVLRDTILSTMGATYEELTGKRAICGDGPDF